MSDLYLIFNHQLTTIQEQAAASELGISSIHRLTPELQSLWGQIPSDMVELTAYLEPIVEWLSDKAQPADSVLIQGDFGACYLMVTTAFRLGLIPVYSTTRREAVEEYGDDGTVKLVHLFKHVIFRRYGR
ncbi:MAG: CRISPR-associated protein Csx20 [Methylococcaceae bacterium]